MRFNPSAYSYGKLPPGSLKGGFKAIDPSSPAGKSTIERGISEGWVQPLPGQGTTTPPTPLLVSLWWYSHIVTVPLTWYLSYKRNQSLGWAFLSGIIATPYLAYRGIEYGIERKK